jgi:hypothetical protein
MFEVGPNGLATQPVPTPTSAKSRGKKTPSLSLDLEGADEQATPTSANSMKRRVSGKKPAKATGAKGKGNKVRDTLDTADGAA